MQDALLLFLLVPRKEMQGVSQRSNFPLVFLFRRETIEMEHLTVDSPLGLEIVDLTIGSISKHAGSKKKSVAQTDTDI